MTTCVADNSVFSYNIKRRLLAIFNEVLCLHGENETWEGKSDGVGVSSNSGLNNLPSIVVEILRISYSLCCHWRSCRVSLLAF